MNSSTLSSAPHRLLSWALSATSGLRRARLSHARGILAQIIVGVSPDRALANHAVSALLADALTDGSNLEADWLWLAGYLSDAEERRGIAAPACRLERPTAAHILPFVEREDVAYATPDK